MNKVFYLANVELGTADVSDIVPLHMYGDYHFDRLPYGEILLFDYRVESRIKMAVSTFVAHNPAHHVIGHRYIWAGKRYYGVQRFEIAGRRKKPPIPRRHKQHRIRAGHFREGERLRIRKELLEIWLKEHNGVYDDYDFGEYFDRQKWKYRE